MSNLTQKLVALLKDEEGLTTVEYAIAGTLVGMAVVGSFKLLGDTVDQKIQDIITALTT